MYDMEHADAIRALGGASAVARVLNRKPNVVVYWMRRGIPARYWYRFTQLPGTSEAGITMAALDSEACQPLRKDVQRGPPKPTAVRDRGGI